MAGDDGSLICCGLVLLVALSAHGYWYFFLSTQAIVDQMVKSGGGPQAVTTLNLVSAVLASKAYSYEIINNVPFECILHVAA